MQPTPALSASTPLASAPARRFLSVDALRGFDMLWIVGAGGLIHALAELAGNKTTGVLHLLNSQLAHKEWEGFAFEDLIFPLFVFLVGVSIVFSLSKASTQGGKPAAARRICKRFVLLYIVALLYSGGVSEHWPDIRLMGVLNRIALAYLVAALAFLLLPPRGLVALCAGILLGYWGLMNFVSFPDLRPRTPTGELVSEKLVVRDVKELNWGSTNRIRGVFEPGVNFAHYIDQKYLPGKKWDGTWDPEGFLSTLPAIGTCLMGVFAGLLIRSVRIGDQEKVFWLIGAGLVSLGIGFLWGQQFPIIKKIWTSSYVLVAAGWSALLLSAFYQMVEIWKWERWVQPFIWVGSNSIAIYLANNIIGFGRLANRFCGGDLSDFLDHSIAPGAGDLLRAIVAIAIGLTLVAFLYRRKIFLRL